LAKATMYIVNKL